MPPKADQTATEIEDVTTSKESADVSGIEAKTDKDKAAVINESKENQEAIRVAAIDNKLNNTDVKVDIKTNYEEFIYELNLGNLDWFLKATDALLKEIEDTIKSSKNKSGLSRAWKETLNNARQKLNTYKETLENKKGKLMTWTNPKIYNDDIQSLKTMRQNVENAKADIAKWQRWELSNTAWYTYNSPENARSSNRAQEHMLQFEQKLQQEIKPGAILNIFNWNTHNATNFYKRIAEWQYTSADYTLYTTYASILNPSFQRCWIVAPTEQWIISPSTWVRTWRCVDYSNTSFWDTLQKWWVAWVLDKMLSNCNNLSPEQRNTRKTIWVLAWFWAWIFWLYKFFTSKKMWFRWKAWITAWVIFWSQVLTWEWPLSLFNKLMTWWLSMDQLRRNVWNAISWIWNSWIESADTIAPAMYSMMVFNSSTTIWDINTLTQQFKSDNNMRKKFYNESLNKLESQYWWQQTTEYFRATFSENFDEQKWNTWLAWFWVVDISNPSNSGKLIYELANNATMNQVVLDKFLSENWVKETSNKTKKQEFKQYINWLKNNNQAINIAILQQHKDDWFEPDLAATYTERLEDRTNKDLLVSQVENLSLDQAKKDELKTAIKTFYDKRTVESKPLLSDFSLEYNDGLLSIISHGWEKTQINLERKELAWFWFETRFPTLNELINAADITNKILASQRWKTPVKLPAFEYRAWGIYFNDAATVSTNFDTRVLSNWRWNYVRTLNPIYNNPSEYARYLSNRRLEQRKIEINSTLYPNVKKLSEYWNWIVFTNENEIKQTEIWLAQIKNKLSVYFATQTGTPFKISSQLPTLNKRLEFTAVNWEKMIITENISNQFPTIVANSEQFLAFMNDPTNWMYKRH